VVDTINTKVDLRFQAKCSYESIRIVMSTRLVIMQKAVQVRRAATEAVAAVEVITAVEVVIVKVTPLDISIQDIARADRYHLVNEETVLRQFRRDKQALRESIKHILLRKESLKVLLLTPRNQVQQLEQRQQQQHQQFHIPDSMVEAIQINLDKII